MVTDIGMAMNRLILSGAKTPTLLGNNSPNKMTVATVANPNTNDHPDQASDLVIQEVIILAQAKKVMLITKLHSKIHVKRWEGFLINFSINRSVVFDGLSCDRWAVVSENNAASLAEKSADKLSMATNEPLTNSQAIELTSYTMDTNHSSSTVLDLPKAKSNSLKAGIIIAAVVNA